MTYEPIYRLSLALDDAVDLSLEMYTTAAKAAHGVRVDDVVLTAIVERKRLARESLSALRCCGLELENIEMERALDDVRKIAS